MKRDKEWWEWKEGEMRVASEGLEALIARVWEIMRGVEAVGETTGIGVTSLVERVEGELEDLVKRIRYGLEGVGEVRCMWWWYNDSHPSNISALLLLFRLSSRSSKV